MRPDIEAIMARHESATRGPWAWFGSARSLYLATINQGRRYVMGFRRWGMQGAQPVFQHPERHVMIPASELLQFEVGDRDVVGMTAANADTSVYRYDVRGVANPDATFMAHSWSDVRDLLAYIAELEALLAGRVEEAADLKRERDDLTQLSNHRHRVFESAVATLDSERAANALLTKRVEELEGALEETAKALDLTAEWVVDQGLRGTAEGIRNDAATARRPLLLDNEERTG